MGQKLKNCIIFAILCLTTSLLALPHAMSKNLNPDPNTTTSNSKPNDATKKELALATFAGGCFWCMQSEFNFSGIIKTVVGYTGGDNRTPPTYESVSSGTTGHYEAILIQYDSTLVEYAKLIEIFLSNIDPTDDKGQFADRGSQYRPAIFYHTRKQKEIAEKYIARIQKNFEEKIKVQILPATELFPAEEYHQDYYQKNPDRYKQYKKYSGREAYIKDNVDKLRVELEKKK